MYFGLGPHLGFNFWFSSETILGYSTTTTWNVGDVGLQFLMDWEGFFITFERGASDVSLSVTAGGDTQVQDIADDATYNRVGFGWSDGFLFELTYTSCLDWASNLGRLEISFGYGF